MKDFTFDPYSDTRSTDEKKSDLTGALASVAGIVAFIAARKKLALTRGVSRDILRAGLGKSSRFEKYLVSNAKITTARNVKTIREATIDKFEDAGVSMMESIRDIFKPLPSAEEQYHIAQNYINKHLKYPKNVFPAWKTLGIKEPSFLRQLIYGPAVVPFKGGTSLGLIGRAGVPEKVGKYGGMLIGDSLYFLNSPGTAKGGGGVFGLKIKGMHASIVNAAGSHLERVRRGVIKPLNPKTAEEFVRKVELAPSAVYESERRQFIKREYLGRFFPSTGETIGKTAVELEEIAAIQHAKVTGEWWQNPVAGQQQRIPTLQQFMTQKVSAYEYNPRQSLTFRRQLLEDAAKTRRIIAANAAKTKGAETRFKLFQFGRKIGISEEFASHGGGVPQQLERNIRGKAEWNFKHPVSGEALPVTPRRYNLSGRTLGSNWGGGEGPWYLSGPGDQAKRWFSLFSTGTFHKVGEKAFGLGISSKGSVVTDFIRDAFGSKPGSYSDMWIKNMFKTMKAVGIGIGAFYTYKFINYLSRQVTGWGPTDVAASAYVNAREFQQSVLQSLGIVNASRMAEKAFPGLIKSPLSHAARLSSPLWMSYAFGRKGGPKGYITGLALGIATALVTWGDITQSPEELHKIYTGEQEIPIRKGRYWLMGKTPFFGGKISYWKKHWYPLLRSRYQYKGGLWDSETEYWAQGTPFSPVLAPLLTGKMWDPYYWERKNYYSRPYAMTGELFEPTMPFAWLANLTIGRILKPSTYMHEAYLGGTQETASGRERGVPPGAGLSMGYKNIPGIGISRSQSPYGLRYQIGMGAYTQTEQMGLLGFAVNTVYERLTGQRDFLGAQSVIQTSRRATGYERSYWEQEIGDPGAGLDEGLTEYFRRFLPHRRTGAEEYNPIPNTMPSWLPGEDYFINFRQGDPYVKVPKGETRLPGKGYEVLNQLHSGIPGVYDAVDRFLILANVAPYSNEYREYQYLAKSMAKNDDYWSKKVERSIAQRNALNQEYEFLDTSTRGVPVLLKPLSSIYRHSLAAITNFPNPLDMLPHKVAVGAVPAHINKWLPYKTPESAYRDFRLYGSEYAMWDEPMAGFVNPFMSKVRSMFDPGYVPDAVKRRREIQEYFDKLKYIKYSNLTQIARDQGNAELASKLGRVSRNTMAMGPYHAGAAMSSIPKEEKSFFNDFSQAEGERRTRIMNMIPSYMRNYYMTAWNLQDEKNGIGPSYDVDYQKSQDMVSYFRHHQLPPPEWLGWHPDVSLDQVKLRVVKNEAFDIHKFNLWESNERQLARQPFTPLIQNINAPSNDLTMLQNVMVSNMEKFGLTNNRVFVSRTPASENSYRMKINVRKDRTEEHNRAMKSSLAMR
jgi:hypothetical protein